MTRPTVCRCPPDSDRGAPSKLGCMATDAGACVADGGTGTFFDWSQDYPNPGANLGAYAHNLVDLTGEADENETTPDPNGNGDLIDGYAGNSFLVGNDHHYYL